MAYDTTVHIGENSPEQVAYKLLEEIAFAEGKSLRPGMTGQKADRAYILSTYWECWRVVQGVGTEELDDIETAPAKIETATAKRSATGN
jgi:hypothetical protein